ncbi:MAG: 5-deoxy-glucuronate isomerase, partial [Micromonosporaceae bacterium]
MEHHLPYGSAAADPWSVSVAMDRPALRVLQLPAGGSHTFRTEATEALLLPLAGGCDVACGDEQLSLTGRSSVFEQVSDFCYLPRGARVTIASVAGGRFAVASAPAARDLPLRHQPAAAAPVELRGAGVCSRQVNNLASADSFECDSLMVVEVLTPGGNWSSYPPHKHDEQTAGETELEEIYYFEVRDGGAGYQRVFGAPDRPIEVLAEVRTGDVVLVPHGWHGPSMAAPGYDMYYLNVMAGPGPERAWRFRDHP